MSSEISPQENIIISFVTTEKAYILAERQNYLVLKVVRSANKKQIKQFIEKQYNVRVLKVNTCIDRDGNKKVYVKLAPEYRALDILERASR